MKSIAVLALLLTLMPGDDDIVARSTVREFRRDELEDWLVDRYGPLYVQDFVVDQLLLRLAEDRGLMPTDAEVLTAWEQEHAIVLTNVYKGDPDGFAADIAGSGYSPESWKRKRLLEMRTELAQANVARARRVITEEQLREKYRQTFGDLGERTSIEVYFFSAYRDLDPFDLNPDINALKAVARQRADEARVRLAAGAGREEILATCDPLTSEFVHDGVLTGYQRRMLGTEVDRALNGLDDPGDTAPVVDVFDGSYVIRLIARESVRFEDARTELEASLLDDDVSSSELAQARTLAIENYDAQIELR